MSTRAILTTMLLLSASSASAECVQKNAYNYVTGEYETVLFSCPPVKASETPKFRSWQACPVHEERDDATGKMQKVRACA